MRLKVLDNDGGVVIEYPTGISAVSRGRIFADGLVTLPVSSWP